MPYKTIFLTANPPQRGWAPLEKVFNLRPPAKEPSRTAHPYDEQLKTRSVFVPYAKRNVLLTSKQKSISSRLSTQGAGMKTTATPVQPRGYDPLLSGAAIWSLRNSRSHERRLLSW